MAVESANLGGGDTSRGIKRERDDAASAFGDDDRDRDALRKPVRKRGRAGSLQGHSNDPLCEGRRIGEECIAGGNRYKVGEDGKRRIHAVVREKRTRYHMVRIFVYVVVLCLLTGVL